MSFLGQDPLQAFLGNKPQPKPVQQPDLPVDDSILEEGKTAAGTATAKAMQGIGTAFKYAGGGLDLFMGLFKGDLEGKEAEAKWKKQEEEAAIAKAKREAIEKQVEENLMKNVGDGLDTTSPYLRKIRSNDIMTATRKIADLYDTLESTEGDMEFTNNIYGFKSKEDYKKHIGSTVVPAVIELLKRKNKNLDARGSIYAYSKMSEEEGSEELEDIISNFSRELTDDANTQALNKYWSDGRWGMGLLQAGVKVFQKAGYGIDVLGTESGIGNKNIVSDFKYTKGGAAEDTGAIGKNLYSAAEVGSDIWDGVPEIVSNLIGSKGAGAIEKGVVEADSFLAKAGDIGYKISKYNDENPAALSFTKNMLSDTFAYDLAAQQFTGKPLTEDDVSMNLMMNLPINAAIGLLARPAITGKALAQQFDLKRTFASDGTLNITQQELELIKAGRSDLAEIMILNRSKLGGTEDVPNLINIKNITGDKELVTKIAETANNLERTIENAKQGVETANQTLQLTTANNASDLYKASSNKIMRTLKKYDNQATINNALTNTVKAGAEGDNVNKFWNNKIMEQVKEGGLNIEEALTKMSKTHPEYANEIALFRQINNIGDIQKGLTSSALKTYGVAKLKRNYGKFLQDLYKTEIVDNMKLVDGERVSPVHVFSQGKIKNVETGEVQEVSEFFAKQDKTAYQKKALKESVLDDLAGNQEVFEFFTKKLGANTQTSNLLSIFNRKKFNTLSETDVTLIRAALAKEMLQDLASRGKKTTLQAMFAHPAYRIFTKNADGTYSIAIQHLDAKTITDNLGTMFKSMDEMSIVQYLADVKAQDDIITSIKAQGLKNTVEANISNQPDFLKNVWRGFSEMLMRKTTTAPSKDFRYSKISKEGANKMIGLLQKAFPNVQIEYGKLPDNVRGSVMPYGGKIIIDESKMGAFTSLHEFGHVWIMHAKAEESEIYEKLTSLIKDSKYYKDVQSTYKDYYTEDWQMIDEAIAHAIEDSGSRFFDSLQKQTFLDSLQELFTKIYSFLKGTASLDKEIDAITAKMFNAEQPISKNNLAELDILQFTKEDFDKNSYFIRHIIQKINEDNLFLSLAKKDSSVTQQEFIFQIINSMIKNTVPSTSMRSTVKNYTHNFNDYINLVNKDEFTEQYIKSEIAKFETANVLRSMMPDAINALKGEKGFNVFGDEAIEKNAVEVLGTEIVRLAKVAGLKRLFRNGSVANILDALKETIDNIKNSDLPLHEKQRALIEQSVAYSNTYLVDTVLKNAKNEKNFPKMTIKGKIVEVDPNILFQALQVMRFPEFALSSLSITDYLKQDYIRKSLPQWSLDIKNIGKKLAADEATSIRLQSAVPVDHIPAGPSVIVTLKGKTPDTTYAKYEDEEGMYMTMDKFLKTDLTPGTNYLVPVKFFNQATRNPEMIEMVKKIKEKGGNIYPVEFTVIQSGNTRYVEQEGFNQLSNLLSIKRSGVELPDFDFVHADSVKGLSRLSENTSNTESRAEIAKILDDSYQEASNAEKYLTEIGVNPVINPVVQQDQIIHNLGLLGKTGEIIRTALRGIIAKQAVNITDNLINGTIITENAKKEWIKSITGDADLSEIYIGGKTVTELADDELENINMEALLDGLSDEEAALATAKYNEMLSASRGTSIEAELKKYSNGAEAFDAIVNKLIVAGYTHTDVSNIIRTMIQQNPGWAKDIFKSKAIQYVPSFDSFIANKIIAPILAVNKIDVDLYTKMLENEYDKTIKATFGSDNNFRDNDHIIALFIQTMQEQGVLPETLDVYAVIANLLPEDRKHLHEVINNYYQGDIWKLIADENTSEYFKSTFSKLKKTFLGTQDAPPASFTNEDVEKGIIEFGDDIDEGSMATRVLDEKDADTNLYETIIGAFLPKLKAFNDFEKAMLSPKVFNFQESTGKPLFEMELNLNTWASQPNHNVLKGNRAGLAYPQKDAGKAMEYSVKAKAFDVFDKRSEATILKFKEVDAINLFEKQTFDSPPQLEEALAKKEVSLTVGETTGKIGESVKIDDSLLEKMLKKIEEIAFTKNKGADATIFTMTTKNGTPREYNMANILNSPIFRTLVEEFTPIVSDNAMLQLFELSKKVSAKIAKENKLKQSTLQSVGSSLRNIERMYKDKISGGAMFGSSSNNMLEEDGLNMVKRYLQSLVGKNVSIEDITHYSPIDEVMKNGNSVERVDNTIEKNTDTSLNDYKQKPIDTQIIKSSLQPLDDKMGQDALFILTDKVTKTSTDGKEYTVTQPLDSYDFTFVYRDIDKKSPTKGKTFEVTLQDGVLSEPKLVDEIIENKELSRTIDPESQSLYESARAEICNL